MQIAEKLDDLGRAFEEFKKTNDKRLEEIKAKGQPSQETETKLAKIEDTIQKLEKTIDAVNAAMARTGGQNEFEAMDLKEEKAHWEKLTGKTFDIEGAKKLREYRKNVNEYIRKGEELPSDLEQFGRKALSVDSETGGGYFVVPELAAEIIKKVHESSPIRQLASVITISSASLKINQDLDRPSSGWVGERASRSTSTSPTVRQIEIFAHEQYAFPEASQSFLDDAAVNVESWLGDYCQNAFALDEATAFITGDGVGKPRGIVGGYADGTTFGYVERYTTNATGAIVSDDLVGMQEYLKEPYQKNASWLMARATRAIVRKIKDGSAYAWQPGLQMGAPETLLSKPVQLAADLNTSLAATTDGLMIYGDFKAGYQIVDRVGIRVLRDPYSNKPFVGFYTTKRVGAAVKNFEALKVLKIHA